jgi:hydrogenase/urease accessory protein HupE
MSATIARRACSLAAALALILIAAEPAHAHLMNTGFGPFYDGLTHLFVSPEDLLPVVALTLLAGLRGPRFGRAVLFALPTAWFAGTVAGFVIASPTVPATAITTASVTIALGVMVASAMPLPLPMVAGVAVILGMVNGGVNGGELATTQGSVVVAAGVAAALFLVVSLVAGQVASVQASGARIVVRVAGSWITAIGLLMLGWSVRRT